MANDGEIRFNTKIDESGLDKGLKSVKGKVDKLGKDTKDLNALKTAFNETGGAAAGFTSKLGGVASSGGVAAAAITAAVMAAKKYIETLKEANEAYKVQEKAEKALSKAAENNPYLNGEGVERLKDFAGEIQKVSNYGDEATIDIMAQLAATGRSEAEIMKIMAAAADYAAAKHIDLKTAAETLNSTYSGMAGTMGRQIAEIKDLTDEQLKNGDAIDLIANKYKGFAADAVDSGTQAKNAFGDFMESLGRLANPTFEELSQKAKSFWESMTEYMNKFNDAIENARKTWVIGGDYQWSKEAVDNIKKSRENITKKQGASVAEDYTEDTFGAMDDYNLDSIKVYLEQLELKGKIKQEEAEILKIAKEEIATREHIASYNAKVAEYAEKYRNYSLETLKTKKQEKEALGQYDAEWTAIAEAIERAEEAAKKAQEQATKAAEKTANDYAAASNKALQENLKLLEVEAKAKGESVDAQDVYNAYLQSYIDLLTKTNGTIQEGYPIEVRRRKELEEAKKALDAARDSEEKLAAAMQMTQAATNAINSIKREMTPAQEMQEQIDALEELKKKIQETSDAEIAAAQAGEEKQLSKQELINGLAEAEKALINEKVDAIAAKEESWWDKYASKQKELLDMKQALNDSEVLSDEEKYKKMQELDEAYKQSKAAQIADLMTQVTSYTNQTVDIINNAANLMLETSKNNAKAEQAALEEKYLKGEISEEEYEAKVTEIKKKAAKEQYKIQMVQWGASLLQATVNIAQGVTKAIAQGGVAGLVTGALVAAAGGVQIASIIANKPTPPNFAGGGFIGGMNGATMGSDNTYIHARTGEMVANAAQQRNLWEAMNGNGGGSGTNIVINNSASNIATAQPKITRNQIEIMIDARVNDSLKNGRYDKSLTQAESGMSGDYYGI